MLPNSSGLHTRSKEVKRHPVYAFSHGMEANYFGQDSVIVSDNQQQSPQFPHPWVLAWTILGDALLQHYLERKSEVRYHCMHLRSLQHTMGFFQGWCGRSHDDIRTWTSWVSADKGRHGFASREIRGWNLPHWQRVLLKTYFLVEQGPHSLQVSVSWYSYCPHTLTMFSLKDSMHPHKSRSSLLLHWAFFFPWPCDDWVPEVLNLVVLTQSIFTMLCEQMKCGWWQWRDALRICKVAGYEGSCIVSLLWNVNCTVNFNANFCGNDLQI